MIHGLGSILQTHGLGGSTDLPIPFLYAMVGASWALTISFAVLALAWKEPQFSTVPVGLSSPVELSPPVSSSKPRVARGSRSSAPW